MNIVALGVTPSEIYICSFSTITSDNCLCMIYLMVDKKAKPGDYLRPFCLCQQCVTLMEYKLKNVLLTFAKLRTVGACVWICRVSGSFLKVINKFYSETNGSALAWSCTSFTAVVAKVLNYFRYRHKSLLKLPFLRKWIVMYQSKTDLGSDCKTFQMWLLPLGHKDQQNIYKKFPTP